MLLKEYVTLKGVIKVKTGLHVGTGEKVERGASTPVILSPRTGLPYVPGSSIKGKMRCLLELVCGRVETDPKDPGSPCWCGKCQICTLFGSGNTKTTFEPTRLIFRDCNPTEGTIELLNKIELEDKPGVRIDRKTGKAAGGALFPMKRVPEGCEFEFEVSVRVFDKDDKEAIKKWLAMGMYLMEQDALGGGGSRGSGHIEFRDIEFDGNKFSEDWREECKKEKTSLKDIKIRKD